MVKDKYIQILDRFEKCQPYLYKRSVDWWPSGRTCISVKLSDGTVYEYDPIENTIRRLRVDASLPDDETMAKELGINLQKFVTNSGMSQNEMASELGITSAMLSRYIHGTSMPSAVKALRIARLLGCGLDELFDRHFKD